MIGMSKRRAQSKKGVSQHPITLPEIVSILVCVFLIILSVTLVNDLLSSTQFHSETIRILDEQKAEALSLSVAVTAASTALSIPYRMAIIQFGPEHLKTPPQN